MSLPTAPSRTMDPDTFDATTEAFIGALPQFETDMNSASSAAVSASSTGVSAASQAADSATSAEGSAVSAAASAATAGALVTASDWISGGTYAVGDIRVSPANRRLYKCILAAGAGQTTDPSSDTTYWKPALFDSMLGDARFAAVSASLPALSYVCDPVIHLAKDDTDKGAWRKKKGQSWRSEARSAGKYLGSYANATAATAAGGATADVFYNTTAAAFHEITAPTTSSVTYRAGREDYPTNALITAEAARVIIWDLDGAQPSMWMVFSGGVDYIVTTAAGDIVSCVAVVGSTLCIGQYPYDINIVNFVWDIAYRYSTIHSRRNAPLSSRNTAVSTYQIGSTGIVNRAVNDVAITILPDAPIDEYGMPVPTIYAFTAGGVSRIAHDGTVSSTATGSIVTRGVISGGYVLADRLSGAYISAYAVGSALPTGGAGNLGVYWGVVTAATYNAGAQVPTPLATGVMYLVHEAIGLSVGLTKLKFNPSDVSKSGVAAITSTYNTGWMVGDIRRCFLANSKTADRSVKAGTLTEVGTVTETTASGGLSVYSGFSAANYFQEASHADWNALGTGDFSIIMSRVKWGTAGINRCLFSLGLVNTAGALFVDLTNTGFLRLFVYTTSYQQVLISATAYTDTAEHTLEIKRGTFGGVANTTQFIIDGVVIASAVSALTISNAAGYLVIGANNDGSLPWTGGQVSCVRISATAPTAEQSKYIAATENALNGGNACLLSNSNSVSALSYDKDTDSYLVGNGTNVDTFKGLKRIASQAHGVTTLKGLASINGRKLIAGTGASYTAPERNISAELLEGQQAKPRTQNYSFTSSGTTKALPQGWKAQGVQFNLTDGTMASASQTFDGFIWTLGSLTNAKAYQIQLVEA